MLGANDSDPRRGWEIRERLRGVQQDLARLEIELADLPIEGILNRTAALRCELGWIARELARAELVACCRGRPSALTEPADVVDLWIG